MASLLASPSRRLPGRILKTGPWSSVRKSRVDQVRTGTLSSRRSSTASNTKKKPVDRRRIVDLSIPIENNVLSDPPPFNPNVMYKSHHETFSQIAPFFPGLEQSDLPDGEAWALEQIDLCTHNGTHLDAPYHFHSTTRDNITNEVIPAKTIDQVPLEWCFGHGVKLDFRHLENGHVVTVEQVQQELERIEYELQPMDIVVINTAAGRAYGSESYVATGCGMSRGATLFLLDHGVKVTGTDAWSWDAPFVYTAERYKATRDASLIWEGHKAGRDKEYCHLEKLNNLELLPSYGFTISCFPVKIRNASAGWTRAVAFLDDDDHDDNNE